MSEELTRYKAQPMEIIPPRQLNLAEINGIAEIAVQSGYFAETKHLAQAAMKILFGQDYGLSPSQSLTGIYIVKGKPSLAAVTLAGLAKRAGYKIKSLQHTDEICELEFFDRDGSSMGKSKWDLKDAKAAGTGMGGEVSMMQKYPRNMLWSRAISNGVKWYCSDIFFGPVYTPEELGAIVTYSDSGEIADVKEDAAPPPPVVEKPKLKTTAVKATPVTTEPPNPFEEETDDDPQALDKRRSDLYVTWRSEGHDAAHLRTILKRDLNDAYTTPNGTKINFIGATFQNMTVAELDRVEKFMAASAETEAA